jgi:hypothetical protein
MLKRGSASAVIIISIMLYAKWAVLQIGDLYILPE